MGDRAQIVVITRGKIGDSEAHGVSLYTHWRGYQVPDVLAEALGSDAGRSRADDGEYLARIIFCRLVGQEAWDGETGFGIGTDKDIHGDLEHRVPVVSPLDRRVVFVPSETSDPIGDAANPELESLSFDEVAEGVAQEA